MSNDDRENPTVETQFAGPFISLKSVGGWQYVSRNTERPAVGIVAVTGAGNLILIEQFRPPLGSNVIELPAGLAGDIAGAEHEPLVEAAQRELLEETGYVADRWTELGNCCTSPGLTDESITLFLAEGLDKQGAGGGDENEDITIHEVPLEEVMDWLRNRKSAIDMKLLAGLYAREQELMSRDA